jgi:hypothetical protein
MICFIPCNRFHRPICLFQRVNLLKLSVLLKYLISFKLLKEILSLLIFQDLLLMTVVDDSTLLGRYEKEIGAKKCRKNYYSKLLHGNLVMLLPDRVILESQI